MDAHQDPLPHDEPAVEPRGILGPLASPLAGGALVGVAFAIHRWLTADPDAPC
jgi:hypothetical protein